jgi:hypothetical protein
MDKGHDPAETQEWRDALQSVLDTSARPAYAHCSMNWRC